MYHYTTKETFKDRSAIEMLQPVALLRFMLKYWSSDTYCLTCACSDRLGHNQNVLGN